MNDITKKRITATLALLVVSMCLISIALTEILLRNFFPIDMSNSSEHRIPHPVFGWVLEPGASYLYKMPEKSVQVTYNSTGWRDEEHNLENDHDTFRILVLGDSFMEGYSVELEDMFHKQIERLGRKERIDIEVINLGVGGYGTLQEYLVFRDIGRHYKPDIVLLGFYIGNDVTNNNLALESGFHFNKKSMKVASRPFLDSSDETTWAITQVDYDGAWQRYQAARNRKESLLHQLRRNSALVQVTLRAVDRAKAAMWNTGHTVKPSLVLFGANFCQEPKEYTRGWHTTKRIFDGLKNEVSNIGAELFVFTVPALYEVLEEEIENVPDRELICWKNTPGYDRLKEVLNELDIAYVDLLPKFRKVMRNDTQNIFRLSDRHWNEEGHYLGAEIVYSALKDRGLLPFIEKNHSVQ